MQFLLKHFSLFLPFPGTSEVSQKMVADLVKILRINIDSSSLQLIADLAKTGKLTYKLYK